MQTGKNICDIEAIISFPVVTEREKNNIVALKERLEKIIAAIVTATSEHNVLSQGQSERYLAACQEIAQTLDASIYKKYRKNLDPIVFIHWQGLLSPEAWKVFSILMGYFSVSIPALKPAPGGGKFYEHLLQRIRDFNDHHTQGWSTGYILGGAAGKEKYGVERYTSLQSFEAWRQYMDEHFPGVQTHQDMKQYPEGPAAYRKCNEWLVSLKTPGGSAAYTKEEREILRGYIMFGKRVPYEVFTTLSERIQKTTREGFNQVEHMSHAFLRGEMLNMKTGFGMMLGEREYTALKIIISQTKTKRFPSAGLEREQLIKLWVLLGSKVFWNNVGYTPTQIVANDTLYDMLIETFREGIYLLQNSSIK